MISLASYDNVLQAVCCDRERFARPEDAQYFLRESQLSISQAIKATRTAFFVSLGVAKQIVATHPAWLDQAAAGQALHDAIELAIRENGESAGGTAGSTSCRQ